eukprot:2492351-Lingulodinium_polyedra.AAC.1
MSSASLSGKAGLGSGSWSSMFISRRGGEKASAAFMRRSSPAGTSQAATAHGPARMPRMRSPMLGGVIGGNGGGARGE